MRKSILALAALLAFGLAGAAQAGKPVNVNRADATMLADSLDGIGLAKAQAIVAWRTQHGGFKRAEDLAEVKGIGARTVERNRNFIRLNDSGAAPVPAARPVAAKH
ncbi:secreted protein containing Competence protein ComEA, helix-hairpin-helix region domain protein [mine drainage metagenome]|uniref:Secreted protein containing Competence protein ComEA, helix-hairpin-helix region domain protein n=1 Tax=mine drainage metagenome TaxID=410659 RepID=T1CFI9_9ZZZZ